MGPDAMILVFWMLSPKPAFSLSSFTFIKRLFSSSLLPAIRVGCKAAETAHSINNAFDQELLMNVWCSDNSASFTKETALKLRTAVASRYKLTMTSWEQSSKLILLKLHKKLPKNSALTVLCWFSMWSKPERWKSSLSGCLMGWLQIRSHHFEVSSSLILLSKDEPFLGWTVTCNGKWILYDNWWCPAQWLDQVEAQSISWNQTCTKKRSWSLSGGLLPVWSSTAFWIPVKPLHLRSVLSKLMRCAKNCAPTGGIGQQNGPSSSPWQCTVNTSEA